MARTLYVFGPAFGLPDPSSFCMKALCLMNMSGLDYKTGRANFQKAPKGKAPYLEEDGKLLGDSAFIKMHLEDRHGVDFSGGYDATTLATGYAFERLCEEQLYWIVVSERWAIDKNYANGPKQFFEEVPMPIRPVLSAIIRRSVRKDLKGHGMGRHSRAEQMDLARRGAAAISDFLGEKPFLLGDEPSGADASVHACMASMLCDHFDSELPAITGAYDNLVAYNQRMLERFFPDFGG